MINFFLPKYIVVEFFRQFFRYFLQFFVKNIYKTITLTTNWHRVDTAGTSSKGMYIGTQYNFGL
jgi:hypothetical protein